MNPNATTPPAAARRAEPRGRWMWRWVMTGLLWCAFVFHALMPILEPRGPYGWGYFRLVDLYASPPLLMLATVSLALASPKPERRRLLTNGALALASFIAAAGAFEVAYVFGVVGPAEAYYWFDARGIPPAHNLRDATLGYRRKPFISWHGRNAAGIQFVFRTDAAGFRNPPRTNRAAIAFVGDSFTEGTTVPEPDTFVERVGRHAAVINFGVGGYGPQQELEVLRRYALPSRPRAIVWQLYEGNDAAEAERYVDEWESRAWDASRRKYVLFYVARSPLCRLMDLTMRPQPQPMTLEDRSGARRRLYGHYPYVAPDALPRGTDIIRRAIAEGASLSREQGVELAVLVIPNLLRVLEPRLRFDSLRDRTCYLPRVNEAQDLYRLVADDCRRLGCSVIDPLPALRNATRADPEGIAFERDIHLDVRGHRVVGSVVLDWWAERGSTAVQ